MNPAERWAASDYQTGHDVYLKPIDVTLPAALSAFIQRGNDTFHCDDGDWKIEIMRAKADPSKRIPAEALIIAKNGLGDVLFLKAGGRSIDRLWGHCVCLLA